MCYATEYYDRQHEIKSRDMSMSQGFATTEKKVRYNVIPVSHHHTAYTATIPIKFSVCVDGKKNNLQSLQIGKASKLTGWETHDLVVIQVSAVHGKQESKSQIHIATHYPV